MPNAKITGNVIGARLKKARATAGFTQVDLSAALSVEYDIEISQNLISRIESGDRPVRDKELQAICRILKSSPNELLGWKK